MAKAVCGCDYVRTEDGLIRERSISGWVQWANREAEMMSKRDGMKWTAFVSWIIWRDAFRISFASQPYNIQTGCQG